jgi:hypothetical protein
MDLDHVGVPRNAWSAGVNDVSASAIKATTTPAAATRHRPLPESLSRSSSAMNPPLRSRSAGQIT